MEGVLMRTRSAIGVAWLAVLAGAAPAAAQPGAAPASGPGHAAPPPAAIARARLLAAAPAAPPAQQAAAKSGLVWDNRPGVRYGEWFTLDAKALLDGGVRSIDPDEEGEGASFEWGRRRLGVEGSITRYVEYEVSYGWEDGGAWRDVYVNARPASYVQVQAGKFKVPFGYERVTGPRSLDFVYRSRVSDALTPGRSIGIMVHGRAFDRLVRYAIGTFADDGDQPPEIEPEEEVPGRDPGEQSRTLAARATLAPLRLTSLKRKYNNLEIGGAYTRGTLPEGRNHLQGDTVYGGDFFGRHYYTKGPRTRVGFEASWALGPVSVAAEYIVSRDAREGQGVGNEAQLDNDLPEIEGRGWYVAGTWVVTGENREGGVSPKRPLFEGGFGAVEVEVRYERLRFASSGSPEEPPSDSPRAANIAGNGERAWTLGATWYLNRWAKLRFNFVSEEIDDAASSPVPGVSTLRTSVLQFQVGF
jgi:phosphate-selective porin